MAEYIKRADAMKICQGYSEHCFETNDSKGQHIADSIEDDIAEIPTADVVEVVFCKECKHWGCVRSTMIGGKVGNCYNDGSPFHCEQPPVMKPTDFCSYGEKK